MECISHLQIELFHINGYIINDMGNIHHNDKHKIQNMYSS